VCVCVCVCVCVLDELQNLKVFKEPIKNINK